MILPTKGVDADRALLTIGRDVLVSLDRPKTVSRLWSELRGRRGALVTFDWFVLALDLLYALGLIDTADGLISRSARAATA